MEEHRSGGISQLTCARPRSLALPIVSRAWPSSIWRVRYIAVLSPLQPLTAASRGGRHWTWDIGPPPPPPRHRLRVQYLLGFPSIGAGSTTLTHSRTAGGLTIYLVATASELEQKARSTAVGARREGEGKINKYRFGQRLWAAEAAAPELRERSQIRFQSK